MMQMAQMRTDERKPTPLPSLLPRLSILYITAV